MKEIVLILSCEHAVNAIPEEYKLLFQPYQNLIHSHRGIDFGALSIATAFHDYFKCNFERANATRLLIDCNRSLTNRTCFSDITALLTKKEKETIIQQYYLPFREKVENHAKTKIEQGKLVLHLSIHSFTPIWNEQTRATDLGILYDPKRSNEKLFAKLWQHHLREINNSLKVRLNYPYRGTQDGFTVSLRKKFAESEYMGIELEMNQKLVFDKEMLLYLAQILPQSLKPFIR